MVGLVSSGGVLCDVLESQKDVLLGNILGELEATLDQLLEEERMALQGAYLCEGG